jgi:hypothetical protein
LACVHLPSLYTPRRNPLSRLQRTSSATDHDDNAKVAIALEVRWERTTRTTRTTRSLNNLSLQLGAHQTLTQIFTIGTTCQQFRFAYLLHVLHGSPCLRLTSSLRNTCSPAPSKSTAKEVRIRRVVLRDAQLKGNKREEGSQTLKRLSLW